MKYVCMFRTLASAVFLVSLVCGEQNHTQSTDSYLEAYKDAKSLNDNAKIISNREYDVGNGPYPGPINGYGNNNVGPDYGYGPPRPVYGPPPSYGPPNYYPPPLPDPVYGVPHAMLGLLDKFKIKLNLFTLAKILLKVILFKKLVSFIAIICLFLFIPWLKHEKGGNNNDQGDDYRQFAVDNGEEKINRLTSFVWDSFAKYDAENANECDSVPCRVRKMINNIDDSLSYRRLWDLYQQEL